MEKKPLRIWYRAAIVVVLLMTAAWFAFDMEDKDIESYRSHLVGRTVATSLGATAYDLQGPSGGAPVVLVHGFSTPSFIWKPILPDLVDAGLRVLRYDLYGRGLSSRPQAEYNSDLFDRQLEDLLDALNIQGPVHLVGFSMGGAVTAIFTARHKERVASLTLIDPAGYPVNIPITGKLVRLPVMGDYIMKVMGDRTLLGNVKKAFYDQSRVPELQEKLKFQMTFKGYKRAILSTLRHFDMSRQGWAFEAVGKTSLPVLLIWGTEDMVVPFENSKLVIKAIPHATFVPIPETGHIPHYEAPEKVAPHMVQFLQDAIAPEEK